LFALPEGSIEVAARLHVDLQDRGSDVADSLRAEPVRLGTAVTNPTLPDFGYITELTGNRTMQIGLQYVF
jgi:hypothetical protein